MRKVATSFEYTLPLFSSQAFARYLAYKRDNNELLLFILRQLASDQLTFNRNRYGGDLDTLEFSEEEFKEKVPQANLVSYSGHTLHLGPTCTATEVIFASLLHINSN